MSSQRSYNLDSLAGKTGQMGSRSDGARVVTTPGTNEVVVEKPKWNGLIWLLIAFVVILIILYIFRPGMVMSTSPVTGEAVIDWGKLIIWSIVFALIVIVLLWLFRGLTGKTYEVHTQ